MTHAWLGEAETTWAAVHVLRGWIANFGVPLALYTDWKNVYKMEPTANFRFAKFSLRCAGASDPRAALALTPEARQGTPLQAWGGGSHPTHEVEDAPARGRRPRRGGRFRSASRHRQKRGARLRSSTHRAKPFPAPRGDILIEVRKGTFLKSFDSPDVFRTFLSFCLQTRASDGGTGVYRFG